MPNVGGLPADWGRVIIDGVVGNEIGNSGMNAQMVNLDAIAEVRLLNNSYRAEYGQSGGSQLQVVPLGGSSQYHGSWYYYGRHERSTAPNSSAPVRNASGHRSLPNTRFNTYGANVGGPVLKGKKSASSSTQSKRRRCSARRAHLAHAVGVRGISRRPSTRRAG
jgi:hypothetical protein